MVLGALENKIELAVAEFRPSMLPGQAEPLCKRGGFVPPVHRIVQEHDPAAARQ